MTSLFWVAGLLLALCFGAQTQAWSWGPAMLALAVGVPFTFFQDRLRSCRVLWIPLLVAVAWIAWGCANSPVIDGARADAMLLVCLLGSAFLVAGIRKDGAEISILYGGLSLAVLVNGGIALVQHFRPEFNWPYATRPNPGPTGLFGHYNYLANFLVAAGSLLLARALFSRDRPWRRIGYGLCFALGAAVIPLSGSRGGILALAASVFLTLIAAGIIVHRKRSRFRFAVLVLIPVAVVLALLAAKVVLADIQVRRGQSEVRGAMADNSARLEWIDLAMRVSARHPVSGGGSRSYSWERNAVWDTKEMGFAHENEPFVHNEVLQTVTDYGWVGAGLVLAALAVLIGKPIVGLFLGSPVKGEELVNDPIHAGVLAAAGGMLLQANLSFVFHLLPSVMMLGLLFGLEAATGKESMGRMPSITRGLAGACLAAALLLFGWRATVTMHRIWPVLYGREALLVSAPETAVRILGEAAAGWPGYRLEQIRGMVSLERAALASEGEAPEWRQRGIDSLRRATGFHPYDPELAVNLANALSVAGFNEEAEAEFQRAILLEGGFEAVFRARYYLAGHLYRLWFVRWQNERRSAEALHEFLRARDLVAESQSVSHPYYWQQDGEKLQKSLAEVIAFLEAAKVSPQAPEAR